MGKRARRRAEDQALARRELDQLSTIIGALVAMRENGVDVLGHPTVYALRALIADTVAMLPLVSLRGTTRVDPQPAIVRRPDPAEPRRATLEKIVHSLTRVGNAFLYVYQRDDTGNPVAVRVLNPDHVAAVLDNDGTRIVGYEVLGRPVSREQIKHIPLELDPGPLGKSPIRACGDAFTMLSGLWAFAGSYWEDGGTPPYALTHARRLTAAQADEFIDQWIEARRKRRPAVLSDGLALQQYQTPSAADALLLDGLNYFDAAIARAFLCPPSIVNVLSQSSLTYATTTDEMRRWLALALYPGYLNRLEAAFTDLTPRGQSVVFDTSNLLRSDYTARVNTGASAVAAGLLTVEEWRAQEGLPPLPNTTAVPLSPTVEGI